MVDPESPESIQSDASSTDRWVLLSSGEITPTEPTDQAFAANPPSSVGSDVSEDPRGRKMRLYAAPYPVEPVLGSGVVPEATCDKLEAAGAFTLSHYTE